MFKVKIHDVKNASFEEARAFRAGARQLEEELNDSYFWYEVAMVYNTWENKKDGDQNFKDFKAMVLGGSNAFDSHEDKILDVLVTFYYSFRSVIGYTTPSTWKTWVNRRMIRNFDLADIAGHIWHESLHNQGLGHPNTNRNSVVYQAGYLVRKRVKERLALPTHIELIYKKETFISKIKRLWRRLI